MIDITSTHLLSTRHFPTDCVGMPGAAGRVSSHAVTVNRETTRPEPAVSPQLAYDLHKKPLFESQCCG
ncbi:MAG: hypothetical protein J2P17_31745, partial [Mycobacterium sp.]|nr:hypothetical protein [Mycobacterium sp.]